MPGISLPAASLHHLQFCTTAHQGDLVVGGRRKKSIFLHCTVVAVCHAEHSQAGVTQKFSLHILQAPAKTQVSVAAPCGGGGAGFGFVL